MTDLEGLRIPPPHGDLVERALARVPSLLAPDRAMTDLEAKRPELALSAVGAVKGLGFESAEGDARVSIYVYRDHRVAVGSAKRAADLLAARGGEVMSGVNGLLMFVGRTIGPDADSRTAHFRLAQLLSAFSGDE